MGLRIAEVERVDDHADIGRILARLADMGNFDQFEVGLVHRRLERLVAVPIAIGLLDDDAALGEQPLEDGPDVEFFVLRITYAEGDVLEIAEERHAGGVG